MDIDLHRPGTEATQPLRADGCRATGMPDGPATPAPVVPRDSILRNWTTGSDGNSISATLPASADAALIAQFDARMAAMFALLDAAIAATPPISVDALRHALHQLAGTAAFFGQIALGTLAGNLDDQLAGGSAIATPAFLQHARTQLRAAAAGA